MGDLCSSDDKWEWQGIVFMSSQALYSPPAGRLSIPMIIRIGVTGHRRLEKEQAVRQGIRRVLTGLDRVLAHTPHSYVAISPLAEGADRLVVNEVLEWKGTGETAAPGLEAVLPLPESEYVRDFAAPESQDQFRSLRERASTIQTMDAVQDRQVAYERAGHYVVDHCDMLIAIWDGKPEAGRGGTAAIVEYARGAGRTIAWINSENGHVNQEKGQERIFNSMACLDAFNAEHLSNPQVQLAVEAQSRVLEEQASESKLPHELLGPFSKNLLSYFTRADLLAQRYQGRQVKAGSAIYALATAAVATSTLQTLFFPELFQLVWFEVAEMAIILCLMAAAHLGDWHRKWIDYRFLAESLRVAPFLSIAGVASTLPKPPPYLRLADRPDEWMTRAFERIWDNRTRMNVEYEIPLVPLKEFLLRGWVGAQIAYYLKASKRQGRRHEQLSRAGQIVFLLTLVAAAIHATGWGELLLQALHPNMLAWVAIVLPAIGGALGAIHMQREYLRNAERYIHMARYLSTLDEEIKQAPNRASLTSTLERANKVLLLENQDWRVLILSQELHAP